MVTIQKHVLYKYRSFDRKGHGLNMLKKAEIWLPSARSFNDPFDSAFTYDLDGLDGPIAEKWIRSALNRHVPHLSPAGKEKWATLRLAEMRADKAKVEKQRQDEIEMSYKKFGICSLSASNDNLLMWAHYAGEHTGFVVGLSVPTLYDYMYELSATKKEFLHLIAVNYTTEFPRANFFEAMLGINDPDYTTVFFATKSVHWKYEEEHRLVYWEGSNTKLTIGHDAFVEIVLGYRISPKNKKRILRICEKHIPSARIFEAKKHDRNFALELIPLTGGT